MADVDGAGIIYYGSPLRWSETLFGDWLEQLGHPISTMLASGEATPVVNLGVTYRSMLRLDDHCRLQLAPAAVTTNSFTLRCSIWGPRTDQTAVDVLVTHAYVTYRRLDPTDAPRVEKRALPSWLANALDASGTNKEEGDHL